MSGSTATSTQDQLTLLQFRYTTALEKLVHANDQVAKLQDERALWLNEKLDLQTKLQAAQQQANAAAGMVGGGGGLVGGQEAGQGHLHHHYPQAGEHAYAVDPSLMPPGASQYGVPGPSSQSYGHQAIYGAPQQQVRQQIIYIPQPPPGPTQEQLEAARQKYGGEFDPFEGLTSEDLEHIKNVTPNWDVKSLTRKSLWSELTDRNGHPVMRKPMDGEDPKFYSAEKSKCQEWHRIFVLAREIVKSLLIPGRTWTDQNEEMRGFAVKALEMKVDQVRWCEDHWKAQILLDSRLVEWNRSWKDKQIAADGLSTGRRAKRRRLAKEAKMAKVGDGDGMDDDKQGHSEDDGAGDESQMVMMDDGQEMHEEAEIDESEV